jgi:CHAT domain-containing protein
MKKIIYSSLFLFALVCIVFSKNLLASPELEQKAQQLYQAGQYNESIEQLQELIQEYQTQDDKIGQILALRNLALVYQELGNWSSSEQALSKSQKILEGIPNTQEKQRLFAQILDVQGRTKLALGQAESALETWKQATDIYEGLGDITNATQGKINQAQALQSLGLYSQAIKSLTQLQTDLETEPDSLLKSRALQSLGEVWRKIGQLELSKTALQKSLAIAERLNSSQEAGNSLLSLGNTARQQENITDTLSYYQQAVKVSSSPATQIQAQLNQLNLYIEQEKGTEAANLIRQIQSRLEQLPVSQITIYNRIQLALSIIELSKSQDIAIPNSNEIALSLKTSIEQAREIGDKRTESYGIGYLAQLYEDKQKLEEARVLTEQALLISQSISAGDLNYLWQWQLGRILKQQGNTKDAIVSYTQSVNTLKSLRSDLVAISSEVQYDFRDQVEPVYRELVDLLLQPNATQEDLKQARETIEALQLAELDNFFQDACLDTQPVQIDKIDQNAAIIYPILLSDRIEVIVALPNQPLLRHTTYIAQTEVENLLEKLRSSLTKPYTLREVQTLSTQVYRWIIQPVAIELAQNQSKTLVFILDGILRNIPMSALYDGKNYLIEKYAIALTPGLQLIDPKPLKRGELTALTAGLSESRHGFVSLSFVEQEVKEIQSVIKSRVLLNQDFTEPNLAKAIEQISFPIVHLATHGQFSSKADQTFILAYDRPIAVNELDTLLRQGELIQSKAIELLVLSACETATGDKRAALGLAGVAVKAGARSTLASLWNLDDETSALMMGQFYQKLIEPKITKAEALRTAQINILSDERYQHPRYWSPYVLVGNWL